MMAHAEFYMTGPCDLCKRIRFIGVCPHGMAKMCSEKLRPLAKEVIEALKQREGEDIEAWAKRLAEEMVNIGGLTDEPVQEEADCSRRR